MVLKKVFHRKSNRQNADYVIFLVIFAIEPLNSTLMKRTTTIILALFIIVFTACEKETETLIDIVTPQTTVSPYGSELSFLFSCNKDWHISISDPWLHASPLSGAASEQMVVITLTVSANPIYEDRTALITIDANGVSKTATIKQFAKVMVPDGAVDLGVFMTRQDGSEYRLFWASCNLGASKPEEFGDYYAFGETETKSDFTWANYKWASVDNLGNLLWITKYNTETYAEFCPPGKTPDNKTELELEDDVAHVKLGGKWRIPSIAEMRALCEQCVWTQSEVNGIKGYEVKSKEFGNTNSIFLPATGTKNDGMHFSANIIGNYNESYVDGVYSYFLSFVGNDYSPDFHSGRYAGRSVRPVTE